MPSFDDTETAAFKSWVIPKLEKISDADAEVLADYVVALVRTDDSEEAVKQNCLESLPDFLHDHTAPFVEDVMGAMRTKSYIPRPPPVPSSLSAAARPFNPPTGPSAATANKHVNLPGLGVTQPQVQKRGFHDRDTSESRDGRDPHYGRSVGAERSYKQMRRGGKSARGGFSGPDMNSGTTPGFGGMPASMAAMSNPASAFGAFDPTNPLAPFLAMQAMGLPFPPLPPMPLAGSPSTFPPTSFSAQPAVRRERCKDYDTKGFCIMGSVCPYEHGAAPIVVPASAEEYDPNKSSLAVGTTRNGYEANDSVRGDRGRRGLARGSGHTTNRNRAPFSQAGPTTDRSNTTIVVEQIPEEKFDEQSVRDFFSEFGNIVSVEMQPYKRLAIVKYDDHFSARQAYESPKVIFDNRFVKVYWMKSDTVPTPSSNHSRAELSRPAVPSDIPTVSGYPNGSSKSGSPPAGPPDEEVIDMAELARKQAEAQKAYEEKMKKRQAAEAQREEVEKKLRAADEERKKLLEKLAAKSKGNVSTEGNADIPGDADLLSQLSTLHAEAQDLGSNPSDVITPVRGGYRGRGRFPTRGRGYSSDRGAFRGRGRFTGPPYGTSRTGVKRLDNRPRRVLIAGIEAGSPADEALRQYILNNFEFESIEPQLDRKDAQIVTFKERYVAEAFIGSASNIPDVGKVEVSWVANQPTPASTAPSPTATSALTVAASGAREPVVTDGDTHMEDQPQGGEEEVYNGRDAELDVADDEDRWMA